MIRLIVLLVVSIASAWVLPGESIAGPVSTELAPTIGPTVFEREIWRLDRAITRWELRCEAAGLGAPVSTDDLARDARRFSAALAGLERQSSAVAAGDREALQGKLATVRSRLSALETFAPTPDATRCASAPVRPPGTGTLARRIVGVAPGCRDAIPVGEETVAWQFPSPAGDVWTALTSGEAWLRIDPSHDGRLDAHTRGSTADTEIAVFETCSTGARPIAVNDDVFGLQSAVGFAVNAGESLWIRVRQRVGHVSDPVLLTVRGTAGGLSGVVTELTTGEPLPDLRVEVFLRENGWYIASMDTDSNGAYTVDGLDADVYVAITTSSDEHLDELWDDRPCDGSCDVTVGDPIVVIDGRVTPGIDFALSRAGAISGRLRDVETGEALPDFRVEVREADGSWAGSSETDAAGRYTVGGLSPGVHFAFTDGPEYRNEVYDDIPCLPYCQPEDGTPIQVAAEETTEDIDFDLYALGSVSGAVTDATTGAPVPFIPLSFYDALGDWAGWGETDATGQYIGGGLEEGIYFVVTDGYSGYRNEVYDDVPCTGQGGGDCEPLSGTPVAVSLGHVTTGVDFALDRLGAITGQVVDELSGGAILALSLTAWTEAGDTAGSAGPNALGTYVLEDLAPGTFFVTTDNDAGYLDELYDDLPCPSPQQSCDPTDGSPIAVVLGAATGGIDFELSLGGAVTGTLRDTFTDDPITFGGVDLWDASGILAGHGETDQVGSYRVDTLYPGTYFASSRTFGEYLDELYDDLPCPGGAPGGCDPTTGTPLAVVLGTTTAGIDMSLELRGGLSGAVTATAGTPLPGVAIDIWDDGGNHVATTATGVAGSYQIDLSSGSFFVSTDAGPGIMNEVYDNVYCPNGPAILGLCDPLSGTAVEVIGADTAVRGIDFQLASPIFLDGFESGDTAAWSTTVP